MKLPRIKIADGIHASLLATNKFKVNAVTLDIQVPMNIENVTMLNLLARVLKRGCEKYPDITSIEKKLDTLYGSDLSVGVSRRGDSQYLSISADFLSREYTEGCDIIREILEMMYELLARPLTQNGAFLTKYVDSEKKNLSDIINGVVNNKRLYAKSRCIEIMCAGEPYAFPAYGTVDALNTVTPEKLYEFYRSIISTAKAEILYTGNEEFFAQACDTLKSCFAKLERNYSDGAIAASAKHTHREFTELHENMPVNQGKLSMGYTTDITNEDNEKAALIVANEIFGGSPNSKLFMNVREKMSLCYYCSSVIDSYKGIMLVNAGIENKNFEVTRDAVNTQLEAVKAGNFADEDFSNALKSLINGYCSISDSVTSLESWYIPRIFRGDSETVEDRIAAVKAVTRQDTIAAANRIQADVVYFLRGTLTNGGEEDDN